MAGFRQDRAVDNRHWEHDLDESYPAEQSWADFLGKSPSGKWEAKLKEGVIFLEFSCTPPAKEKKNKRVLKYQDDAELFKLFKLKLELMLKDGSFETSGDFAQDGNKNFETSSDFVQDGGSYPGIMSFCKWRDDEEIACPHGCDENVTICRNWCRGTCRWMAARRCWMAMQSTEIQQEWFQWEEYVCITDPQNQALGKLHR